MPFPNYRNKYTGEAIMRPEDTIEMRKRFGKFPKVSPPSGLIFCMKNGLPEKLRWRVPIRKVGKVMGDMFLVKKTKGNVGVLSNFGIGAPVVVSLAEEMISFGVKKIIILSWAGALQKNLVTGDLVINDSAIRDDGVSHHYIKSDERAYADVNLKTKIENELTKQNAKFYSGSTWTTDAPYRETKEEILKYQLENVQTVEMEIAGLFTLGQVRGVQVASIVIVADSLANLAWQPPQDMKRINQSFEIAYKTAIQVLNQE
ncbi:MAG: nucleoside phosphorylase [Anaerolineales bacterium]|nr:nucleoside phosphorylase [Anaerolineales bacterium]